MLSPIILLQLEDFNMKKYVWQYLNSTVASLFKNKQFPIESGTFTPTVSNETYNEVVVPLAAYYSRVNNVVNCTYFLDVALDAAETEAEFELSLPVPSNFTTVKDLVGIVAFNAVPADLIQWGLQAETVNNTAKIYLQNANMGNGFQYIYITVQYLVF